jgi:hypothetical protein
MIAHYFGRSFPVKTGKDLPVIWTEPYASAIPVLP